MFSQRFVYLYTSNGVVTVELYGSGASSSIANSFWRLACSGQLSGACVDRVIPGVALICHTCTERDVIFGLCSDEHYSYLDRNEIAYRHVGAGLLSAKRSSAGVLGSTFLLTLGPQPLLDDDFSVFGRVIAGMKIIDRVSSMPVSQEFCLRTPLIVERCRVELVAKDNAGLTRLRTARS